MDASAISKFTIGTFSYVLDLNGAKHYTRNKGDLAQREKEFYFLMQAMDLDRREYGITYDLVLQAEINRRMLCDMQAEDRLETFMSCGLISRVHRISVFSKTEKLKLMLMGSVLLEGSYESSLNLVDFVTGDKLRQDRILAPATMFE
jgi:hypothetical protein